ncbi:hypothetical protein GCM10025863_31610 [Microbacterium suwonense]|uniref:Peptidase M3A/M3B catalytic domain-containing protein n=1 Tax=Microbacterium suwonense TaxID=683047 RepID=A0ABM8FXT2_9MICO|nr:hypothetical protein GCM10025863_31610 [Microbacterium suwonense]
MTDNIVFPTASGDWLAFVTTRVSERLGRVEELADRLKDGTARTTIETLSLWNELQIALRRAHSESSVLCEVHPDAEVRAAAEKGVTDTQAVESALMADAALAAVFAATDPAGLDTDAARVRDHLLRDFRRGGADRDEATRQRAQELAARDSELSLAFARNIREGRREIRVAPEALDGLPEDFIAQHPIGEDGLVALSTDNLDVMAVVSYARDRATRVALHRARADLAWPANDPVLAELLDVRQQRADLLGYASWADYETETRMAGSAARIASFLDEVDEASRAASDAEYELLLARLRQEIPDAAEVSTADQYYLLTRLHEERFAVDSQEVRRHLDFERVLAGLLDTTGRLFDIEYVPTDDPAWHQDVRSYDVVRAGSGSAASTSICTRARASSTTPRASRSRRGCAGRCCPRRRWCAISLAD